MRRLFSIMLLLILVLWELGAQVAQDLSGDITVYGANSGSPYSAFGLGDILSPGFGQVTGLSGTGIGLANPYFVNNINPASLTAIERPVSMIFDFGLNFGASRTGGEESSPFQIDGGLTTINLWFRINPWWASNLGMQPYSRVGYNLIDERYDLAAGGEYQMVYTGKGGLNRIYWGNAFQITRYFSVGANLNLLFGTIEDTQTFVSENTLGSFSIASKNYLRGMNYDAGLQYQIPLGRKKLVLGLIYAGPVNLKSEKTSQLFALQDTLEQVNIWDEAFLIPQKIGGGLSFEASKRLTLAADVSYQPWSEGRLNEELQLRDTRAVSFGAEFIPSYNKYLGYYQQTLVRAGVKWQNSYLEIGDKQVKEWQMSAGMALPFNRYRHHLNISYAYSFRGTSALMETRHQISFNVSLRDVWFVRPKIK